MPTFEYGDAAGRQLENNEKSHSRKKPRLVHIAPSTSSPFNYMPRRKKPDADVPRSFAPVPREAAERPDESFDEVSPPDWIARLHEWRLSRRRRRGGVQAAWRRARAFIGGFFGKKTADTAGRKSRQKQARPQPPQSGKNSGKQGKRHPGKPPAKGQRRNPGKKHKPGSRGGNGRTRNQSQKQRDNRDKGPRRQNPRRRRKPRPPGAGS